MGNCIKTQLKQEVNNRNLNFLGGLPIYVKESGSCAKLNIGNTAKTLVHPDGTKEQVSGNIVSKFIPNGNLQKFELLDNSKYNFSITAGHSTITEGLNNLVYIKAEDLQYATVASMGAPYAAVPIGGNVKYISKNISVIYENITVLSFRDDIAELVLTGNDDDFATFISKFPNVTNIYRGIGDKENELLLNFSVISKNTNAQLKEVFGGGLSGDIYPFIQKARINNREEGTLLFSYFNNKNFITVDEEELPSSEKKIYARFKWTANSISLYNSTDSASWALYKSWNK